MQVNILLNIYIYIHLYYLLHDLYIVMNLSIPLIDLFIFKNYFDFPDIKSIRLIFVYDLQWHTLVKLRIKTI